MTPRQVVDQANAIGRAKGLVVYDFQRYCGKYLFLFQRHHVAVARTTDIEQVIPKMRKLAESV